MSSFNARMKRADDDRARRRAARKFSELRAFCAEECAADYEQTGEPGEWDYSVPVERPKDTTHRQSFAEALDNNAAYLRDLARRADVQVPEVPDLDRHPEYQGPIPTVAEIRDAQERRMLQALARAGVGV